MAMAAGRLWPSPSNVGISSRKVELHSRKSSSSWSGCAMETVAIPKRFCRWWIDHGSDAARWKVVGRLCQTPCFWLRILTGVWHRRPTKDAVKKNGSGIFFTPEPLWQLPKVIVARAVVFLPVLFSFRAPAAPGCAQLQPALHHVVAHQVGHRRPGLFLLRLALRREARP